MDVLRQDIDQTTRKLTREKINEAYSKALDNDDKSCGPAIESIEELLYKDYRKKPRDYIKHVAKLVIFIDPTHHVGQFAKMFRLKALQNVYTPERIIQLDITDMLPEVFLNPKADPAAKLDVYQSINRLINDEGRNLTEYFNFILNPTSRIPTRPTIVLKDDTDKLIDENQTDVKNLCENPFWKMKRVNMIICKEDRKFYCLDIEKLLNELAATGTATNYFTKNPLSQEIIDNINSRYTEEINDIKSGKDADIGWTTEEELVDLKKTVAKLTEFKENFNDSLESIEIFGIDFIDTVKNVPPMVQEEFRQLLEELSFDEAVKKVNEWVDNNIAEIIKLGAEEPAEPPQVTEVVVETQQVTPQAFVTQPAFVKSSEAEEKLVKDQVLKENTVSFAVYNDYLDRLGIVRDTILDTLKTTHGFSVRSELNSQLLQANKQLKEARAHGRSINGMISLLQSALNASNIKLENITQATGMGMLYPQQVEAAQQEKAELEQYVKHLQVEIAYLQELYTLFIQEK